MSTIDSSSRDRAIEAVGWLRSMVSTSSRDWAQSSGDALIYGVLVGWGCPPGVCDEAVEDAGHCCSGAVEDLAARHGWTAATVEKMRERREALHALAGGLDTSALLARLDGLDAKDRGVTLIDVAEVRALLGGGSGG